MNLFTNRILVGQPKVSLNDLIAKVRNQGSVKTASVEEETVKVAESEPEEGKSSGQLDVEPLHQKGESTGEKPAGHDTQKTDCGCKEKKSEADAKVESKVAKKEEAEGPDSGQPAAEAKLVNHPEVKDEDKGCKKGCDKKSSEKPAFVKVANLDGKSKEWLKKYWEELYPADYVSHMLSDK